MAGVVPIVAVTPEDREDAINRLIGDLSLGTLYPIGPGPRTLINASASARALGDITMNMTTNELRNYDWLVEPLVVLMKADIYNPAACKAAFGLKTLMFSRVCMSKFLNTKSLDVCAKLLDIILSKDVQDLKIACNNKMLVENLAEIYREIARFYPWDLVNVGGIKHCVSLLRYGDINLQTIAATVMASLSADLEICKQMFSYGAIKPLLMACDSNLTNNACMLSGLGCVTQLCRIPEIGMRMVQQGSIPILEMGLHTFTGHGNRAIREKSLYSLGFLSKIDSVRGKIMSKQVRIGLATEFEHGTITGKATIMQLLMNVHNKYEGEFEYVHSLQPIMMELLRNSPWNTRNLAIKAICVLYNTLDDRLSLRDEGMIECLIDLMDEKNEDLQEAPLVGLIFLCVHQDIPRLLLEKGVAERVAKLLYAQDHIIRELAVIVLKALNLYEGDLVRDKVPADKQYMLVKDEANPQEYGGDYGGMIQEYLQKIVQNRRRTNYLREGLAPDDIENLKISEEELQGYENTFMTLDVDCGGSLDIDELKLLMVLMGETYDAEELQLLLDEYDEDQGGSLDFREFVIMMHGWSTRFGTGPFERWYNQKTKRGAIGKARRWFTEWWTRNKRWDAQVAEALRRRRAEKKDQKAAAVKFQASEALATKRKKALIAREMGITELDKYGPQDTLEVDAIFSASNSHYSVANSATKSWTTHGGGGSNSVGGDSIASRLTTLTLPPITTPR